MVKKNKSFLNPENSITIFLVLSLFILPQILIDDPLNFPIPTEIIERKKDRKLFKQNRNEWMENMHRSSSDVDWKRMDENTRNNKFISNTLKRKSSSSITPSREITTDVPGEWHERGSNNQAGRIRTSVIDHQNEEIYCASSGGNIWRGNMDGSNWISLNDYYQIKGIHFINRFSHNELTRMIVVNDKNCFRTDDNGYIIEGASGLESVQQWGWIFRAIQGSDENRTIFLGAIECDYDEWTYLPAIYRSIDNGESFTRIVEMTSVNGFNVGTSNFDLWIPDNGTNDPLVMNDDDVYLLDGDSFEMTPIGNINSTSNGNNILIGGLSTDDQVFLHARIGDMHHASSNGGISWENIGTLPTGTFTINSFECSKIDPNKLAIGNVDGYRTNDGGQTWIMINNWWEYYSSPESKLHADLPELNYVIDPESGDEFQLICTDGGIYISYDHFENVENLSLSGLGVSQYYSTYTGKESPYHVYAGSQDQGFQRHLSSGTYDGVLDFEQTISGDYGHIVSSDGGTSLWTDYPGFVMYYPDIANSIEMVSWDFQGSGYLWLPPIMNDPDESNIVYIGGGGINSQNHLVKVTNGIGGMYAEDLEYSFESKISAMAYSHISTNLWYVSTEDGHFFYSDDGGESFTETSNFSGPESHYFYGSSILPSPVNSERVYIGGSGYSNPGIYLSQDGGETFESFDEGLPSTLVYGLACLPDESMIFAATEVGPYSFSFENGVWTDMSNDVAPEQVYWSVEYIHEIKTVRFGTYGRGIWDYTFDYNPILEIGDINQDEIVNIDDIISLVAILMSGNEISDQILGLGDINYDDILDIFDLLLLVDMI